MIPITLTCLSLTLLALLMGLLVQQRRVERYRDRVERVRREKEAVIQLMDNIGERMTRGIDLNETLKVIAEYVVKATKAESGAIFLLDETGEAFQARVIVGQFPPLFPDDELLAARKKHPDQFVPYPEDKIRNRRIRIGDGIVGEAMKHDQPLLITDAEADPRIPREAGASGPTHSLMFSRLRVRGRDFGVLAVANKRSDAVFNARDSQLLHALADQAAVTVDLVKLHEVLAKQQRLERELEIAREFQRMLLPAVCPAAEGYDFSAVSQPALMVGGDFYDFIPLDAEHLGIVIGDVSGKGIPGALIMATVRSDLRAEARGTLSPIDALQRVNERLLTETKEDVFVTMTYAILDLPRRRLKLVRAGHEPTLLARREPDGETRVRAISPEGMAVGLLPAEVFDRVVEEDIQLQDGDLVLLYTDGVIEAINGRTEEFGRDRLMRLLSEGEGFGAKQLLATISEDVERHTEGIPQHDDITMIAIEVKPSISPKSMKTTPEKTYGAATLSIG